MGIFEKLIKLANDLDKRGYIEEADGIDKILREAVWYNPLTWFQNTQCMCGCNKCRKAKEMDNMSGFGRLSGYEHCGDKETGCGHGLHSKEISQAPVDSCTCRTITGGPCQACANAAETDGASLYRVDGDKYSFCDPNCPIVQKYTGDERLV
jgi:hypothetical protein